MDDMRKINEMGTIFMGLGILFAFASFLIYRRLLYKESLKVDFSASRKEAEKNHVGGHSSELAHYSKHSMIFDQS